MPISPAVSNLVTADIQREKGYYCKNDKEHLERTSMPPGLVALGVFDFVVGRVLDHFIVINNNQMKAT